jgi:AcrR family transcriptional regulator
MSTRRIAAQAKAARKPAAPSRMPARRGRPRSLDVRRKVLEAAGALLAERGFKATTMEAIAERAGASKVTLYRWWPNKAAVVFDAFFSEHRTNIDSADRGDVSDELRAHMRAFCKLVNGQTGKLLRGLVAEGVLDPVAGQAWRERWVAPRRAEMRALLERAVLRGELPAEQDLELVTDALFGPLYHRLLTQHQPLSFSFADDLCTIVLRGLRCPSAK